MVVHISWGGLYLLEVIGLGGTNLIKCVGNKRVKKEFGLNKCRSLSPKCDTHKFISPLTKNRHETPHPPYRKEQLSFVHISASVVSRSVHMVEPIFLAWRFLACTLKRGFLAWPSPHRLPNPNDISCTPIAAPKPINLPPTLILTLTITVNLIPTGSFNECKFFVQVWDAYSGDQAVAQRKILVEKCCDSPRHFQKVRNCWQLLIEEHVSPPCAPAFFAPSSTPRVCGTSSAQNKNMSCAAGVCTNCFPYPNKGDKSKGARSLNISRQAFDDILVPRVIVPRSGPGRKWNGYRQQPLMKETRYFFGVRSLLKPQHDAIIVLRDNQPASKAIIKGYSSDYLLSNIAAVFQWKLSFVSKGQDEKQMSDIVPQQEVFRTRQGVVEVRHAPDRGYPGTFFQRDPASLGHVSGWREARAGYDTTALTVFRGGCRTVAKRRFARGMRLRYEEEKMEDERLNFFGEDASGAS